MLASLNVNPVNVGHRGKERCVNKTGEHCKPTLTKSVPSRLSAVLGSN